MFLKLCFVFLRGVQGVQCCTISKSEKSKGNKEDFDFKYGLT